MLKRMLAAVRPRPEPPIDPVDLETLRVRIGDPAPPSRRTPDPAALRIDGPRPSPRSWREAAGLGR